ncbi:RNA exonuclease 4 isoform X2 [Andrena cerasifolii]|uniref:RNA exonuclease 4 isoform X2 n=1 Tax=Andrena cerasifolii TaxID=2819439 RepID=UPI0040380F08
MKRKMEERREECCCKKSAIKRPVDEEDRISSLRVIPHTERNASGRNWELSKTIICNSSVNEPEGLNKEHVKKKPNPQHVKKKPNPQHEKSKKKNHLKKEEVYDERKKKLTKQVAMDCEMVGIGDGTKSMIARVSVVNLHGFCVYDKYVKPREPVQDYRTKVSGIRPHNLQNGEDFQVVQKEVAEILRGRVLVGHALKHDLDVLYLSHPWKHLRDTSRFKIFRQVSKGNTPSLKKLACELLGWQIQTGEHSSVEDARVAMQLYVLYKSKWESEFYSRR